MTRTWAMFNRDSNGHLIDTGFRTEANGPAEVVRKAGCDSQQFDCVATRRGYGHFSGCVLVRDQITVACGGPADIVLKII